MSYKQLLSLLKPYYIYTRSPLNSVNILLILVTVILVDSG